MTHCAGNRSPNGITRCKCVQQVLVSQVIDRSEMIDVSTNWHLRVLLIVCEGFNAVARYLKWALAEIVQPELGYRLPSISRRRRPRNERVCDVTRRDWWRRNKTCLIMSVCRSSVAAYTMGIKKIMMNRSVSKLKSPLRLMTLIHFQKKAQKHFICMVLTRRFAGFIIFFRQRGMFDLWASFER